MINMEDICLDEYTSEDMEKFISHAKDVLVLFIYNKNRLYNGCRCQIDEGNSKVRTELRSGISFAPVSVLSAMDGCTAEGCSVTYGANTLVFAAGNTEYTLNGDVHSFTAAPFEMYGHTYIPVKEAAEALGLTGYVYYDSRLTVIGPKNAADAFNAAVADNPALVYAGADAVIGEYDAYKFTHEDYMAAKDKWRKYLVGTPDTIDTNDPIMMDKVNSAANHARNVMKSMNRGEDAVILWGNQPPSISDDLMNQYANIRALAVAWGTYGSDLYHSKELADDILYAFKWMYENMYGEAEIEERGWRSMTAFNWWHWYVGGPESMMDAMLITEELFTDEQKRTYLKAFKHLLDTTRQLNTQDQCSGRMSVGTKCALLLEDPRRLTISANDYHIMLEVKLAGPGTHTDYCNYQHGMPYNMVYGKSNLHRVLKVGAILAGTPLEFSSRRYYNQYKLFRYMFEACMFRGRGFSAFLGRSTQDTVGVETGVDVVRHIFPMIGNYGAEEDFAIKHFIKYSLTSANYIDSMKHSCLLSDYSTLLDILNDDSIPDETSQDHAYAWFSADRAVRQTNDYAITVAMPSYRHPSYECINRNNPTGWYTGDGALLLHTKNDPTEFDPSNYILNTRLAHRIPGTTIDSRERQPVSISEGWIPDNDIVGCMDFGGRYITAGMDYTSYNMAEAEDKIDTGYGGGNPKFPNDLKAKKAYFMFDDECVCLGAGITSTIGTDINTIVEHRRLLGSESVSGMETAVTVNGIGLPKGEFETVIENPSYMMVDGYAGFVFADSMKVSASRYSAAVDKDYFDGFEVWFNNDSFVSKPFVEIMINHGKNPSGDTYAYALLPGADDAKLAKYAADPDFEIISNTVSCQAVREKTLGVTGIIFYEAGECAGIRADRPCIVTFSDVGGEYRIKVCEPTNKSDEVNLEIMKPLTHVSSDSRFKIECGETVKLTLDASLTAGEGFEAVFHC